MAVPIIFNLPRRTEHRGPGLVDHAARLSETRERRRHERGRDWKNGRDTKHNGNYKKASGEARKGDKQDAFIASPPCISS